MMNDVAAVLDVAPQPETADPRVRQADEHVNWPRSIPYLVIHVSCLAAIFTGVTTKALVLCFVLYWVRIFFVTAGYHRYFAHRSYKMRRVPQFIMAFGAQSSVQKGVLWWCGHHRAHHRWADTRRDLHSPIRGFWWSHTVWFLCDKNYETDVDSIRDFARYPELRFLNRFDWLPGLTLAVACFMYAGAPGLVVGFVWSTVLVWHSTYLVNSAAHVFGRRVYNTDDTSRNSTIIAVLTMGEGWHNNHHYYPSSARQGFRWWQIDATYYVLNVLSWVRVVTDLRKPPKRVLTAAKPNQ